MIKSNRFLWSRRCQVFSPEQARCFSAAITQSRQYTTSPTPTHFDFSGSESSDIEKALISALGSCATNKDVTYGRQIHCRVLKSGFDSNGFICNSLLNMYAKCRVLSEAESVFCSHTKLDSASFNIMIDGYVRSRRIRDALKLFDVMPDRSCVSYTTLIKGYAQNDRWSEAMELFREMRSSGRNLVTWNVMLNGYSKAGLVEEAKELFDQITEKDIVSWGTMIDGWFVKNGMVEEAREVFDQTREKDIFSWNAMISGYAQSLSPNLALHLFREMISSSQVKPDVITMVSVFSAISSLGSLEEGIRAHEYLNRSSIPPNNNLTAAVIDMYAKCGSIETALNVFRQTKNISSSTISPWNAIICGSATHGHAKLALDLYSELQSLPIKPNSITFVGVLSACCHAGLVELGKTYFDSMKEVHGIEPDIKHYGCMVDLLGKAGRLEEAIDMIKKMPVKADVIIWGILLSASRIHRNVEVAEMAATELAAIEPTHEGCKVLLSNVYADAGRWEDVALVREEMRTSDVEWSRAFSGVV
ncbi:BnaC09g38830D [Brassica napus]|uniref:BnaC09g38830D protein n=1 Tax=Brassica napus TaxID=3708 RepID=A0A078FNL6_BRANA|nr:BnaC09g38830D [Brassica napus]